MVLNPHLAMRMGIQTIYQEHTVFENLRHRREHFYRIRNRQTRSPAENGNEETDC